MTELSTIAFRTATPDDDADLRAISELDSARVIHRPAALAVVDGRTVAAISLEDGRVVADPFVRTQDAVALLRARIATAPAPRARRRGHAHLPRLRPAA